MACTQLSEAGRRWRGPRIKYLLRGSQLGLLWPQVLAERSAFSCKGLGSAPGLGAGGWGLGLEGKHSLEIEQLFLQKEEGAPSATLPHHQELEMLEACFAAFCIRSVSESKRSSIII